MARTKLLGYRCERCSHEWVPRESDQEPRVCPKCKSPYWDTPSQTNQPYDVFKVAIEKTLQESGKALTWTEIRTISGLCQKFPNNKSHFSRCPGPSTAMPELDTRTEGRRREQVAG